MAQASISDTTPLEAKKVIEKNMDFPYEVIEEIIRGGQKQGKIKRHDSKEMSLMFWTIIKGLACIKQNMERNLKPLYLIY